MVFNIGSEEAIWRGGGGVRETMPGNDCMSDTPVLKNVYYILTLIAYINILCDIECSMLNIKLE